MGIALFFGAIMLVSGLLFTEGPLRSGYYSGPDIDTGVSGGGGSGGGGFSSGGGFSGGGGGFGGGGASGRW